MGKTYNNNEINGGDHVHDLLPAYIDKSLEETERVRVRVHLEECVDCRADYVELQATRYMLKQMPVASVPRAFTITPEMVKGARKTSLLERIFAPRTAPTFASGAVVAFGLMLFLFISSTLSTKPSSTGTVAFYEDPATSSIMRNSATETQADPYSGAGNADTMAGAPAPTNEAQDQTANSSAKQSPTQPNESEVLPPAPAGTPAPGGDTGYGGGTEPGSVTQPTPLVTPITDIASTDTSSPTTVFYDPEAPVIAPSDQISTEDTDGTVKPLLAQSQPSQEFNLFLAVEIGLLIVGLALAGAYLVARRG